jgi:lysophospholipase L1-like esterase
LPFLDMLPLMRAAMLRSGRSAPAFFIDTDHLSARGHRLVAESIVAEIRMHCWLGEGVCPAVASPASQSTH